MYLYPKGSRQGTDLLQWVLRLTEWIDDQRYAVGEIPAAAAYVSVLVYTSKASTYCKAVNGRSIAVIDIVESKA